MSFLEMSGGVDPHFAALVETRGQIFINGSPTASCLEKCETRMPFVALLKVMSHCQLQGFMGRDTELVPEPMSRYV